ncbi:MAG TPA: metal-dependent transcriptional regulator [Candidatus Acidoferrum sp.]|nr:metal-dependent transcriptional regulator [Candidatus Acidoferrum sp.]
MQRTKTSVSQEDYLKAIWELVEEGQQPIGARLAKELGVTPPAVTAAVKRMRRDDLVSVARDGRIDLTRKGRDIAGRMALRHQLAEMLLTDVIGLPWSKAHDEAEQLEHAISPQVEALLLKRFADKKACPHGVPLRGGFAQLRKQGAVLLSDLREKDTAEIICVYEKDGKFLEFLDGLRLHPGTRVNIVRREYDETLTLRVEGKTLHLGKPATSRIWVRQISQNSHS